MKRHLPLLLIISSSLFVGCNNTGGWSNNDVCHPVYEGVNSGEAYDPYDGFYDDAALQTDYRMVSASGKDEGTEGEGTAIGPDGVYDYQESSYIFH